MLELSCRADGRYGGGKGVHRKVCDAATRAGLAGDGAAARECVFSARSPRKSREAGVRQVSHGAGLVEHAAGIPGRPDQRVLAWADHDGWLHRLPSEKSHTGAVMPRLPQIASGTRRDLLKVSAGVAAGTLLSPLPWRMIKDASLLSENWPGIPVPVRGELHTRNTNCGLCPAGCPLKARCVGE